MTEMTETQATQTTQTIQATQVQDQNQDQALTNESGNGEAQAAFVEVISHLDYIRQNIPAYKDTKDFVWPTIVKQSSHGLTIAGLPPITPSRLNDSAFAQICHDYQHLYRDGDFLGQKFIDAKITAGKPLRNTSVHISFSYTLVYVDGEVIIKFFRSNNENDCPLYLHEVVETPTDADSKTTTDTNAATASESDRQNDANMDAEVSTESNAGEQSANGSNAAIRFYQRAGKRYSAIAMADRDITIFENMFSMQCAQQIQAHINRTYLDALTKMKNSGVPLRQPEPDYYDTDLLIREYAKYE